MAGLFLDDTINELTLTVGERPGPHGGLVSIDVTLAKLEGLSAAIVDVVPG